MIEIHEIAYHRNGVAGNGFHAVLFTCEDGDRKVAAVFEERGNVAVLGLEGLAVPTVQFGVNSYRGDVYEIDLRAAISAWDDDRADRMRRPSAEQAPSH